MTDAALPNWPILLTREQLCRYLGGMDERTLVKVCPVAPVDFGSNLIRYSRDQVDAWIRTLPPRVPRTGSQGPAVAEDLDQAVSLAQAAVERAHRRAEGRRWQKAS